FHVARRPSQNGRGSWSNWYYKTIRRFCGFVHTWLEVVDCVGSTTFDLLLRALWICKHHCARDSDVHTISRRNYCSRYATISRGPFVGVFFKPGSVVNSLRHNTSSNLFWR